ncbi:MAG: hypothetical protein Solivirus3_19 [Solivirus sp.]|uniref:Uncharacterized protein n=1 Tax=Solivirus sp. TaxID=2487772 RepID=A0A3G5AJX0_9VIRU|nr:MAG: hypothetical protein Solivirus3_19 [Solivirus sp.]
MSTSSHCGPLFRFSDIPVTTMTSLLEFDSTYFNLWGVFVMLPTTKAKLDKSKTFVKKQNKIVLPPEMNIPGEIISMRFAGVVRGIVRAEKPTFFSHAIIIDAGSSKRIMSLKLSKGTIEFTGATSTISTIETANTLLNHIKQAQENLFFMRDHLDLVYEINQYLEDYGEFPTWQLMAYLRRSSKEELSKREEEKLKLYEEVRKAEFTEEEKLIGYQYEKIINFYIQKYGDYENSDIIHFLTRFAETKNLSLFEGTLKIGKNTPEMTNVLWNLGFPIIQSELAKVMNSPPFLCKYTNANSSFYCTILHYYKKLERTSGKTVLSCHTIRVNRSGHITYSGPSILLMEPVYYAFMKKIIQNIDKIRSTEKTKQLIRIRKSQRVMSIEEWKRMIRNEIQLKDDILNDRVPMATCSALDTSMTPRQLKELSKAQRKAKKNGEFDTGAFSVSVSAANTPRTGLTSGMSTPRFDKEETLSIADSSLNESQSLLQEEDFFNELPVIYSYD